jgi:hypothetical protein
MKKKIMFLAFLSCMITTPVLADMYYQMDPTTAYGMTQLAVSDSTTQNYLSYVGYNTGASPDLLYGDTMTYMVGFSGHLQETTGDDSAIITIGLGTLDGSGTLSLSGTHDNFLLPISNDNNQIWRFQAYVWVNGDSSPLVSGWEQLVSEEQTNLIVSTTGLDYSTVSGIGFMIEWKPSINGNSTSDDFHASVVVPTPAAVILGILGLGAVGIKLRKYA